MKNLRHKIDLNAPGGIAQLFAANRALFGDATMKKADEEDSTTPTPTPDPDASKESTKDDEKLGEPGLKALQAERDARAAEKARADAAEARLREIDERELSDADKAKRDAETQRQEATSLRLENDKLRAIAEHGVPKEYQDLVGGTDAASFLASAEKVADLARKAAGTPQGADVIREQGGGDKGGDKSGGSLAAGRELYNSKHKK